MSLRKDYPENRLDIRIDEDGNISYMQNADFAKYYAPAKEECEAELEELRERLELLGLDEPDDVLSIEYEEWEEEKRKLEEEIEDLENETDTLS